MTKSQTSRKEHGKLSERQKKILAFIELFLDQHGYPPTIREIGAAVDIGSTSVVNYNLNKLAREGFMQRSGKVSRGLQLTREEDDATKPPLRLRFGTENFLNVPLAGQIVASRPVEFFGMHFDEDASVDVPVSLLGKVPAEQLYALRVSGNSMIDAMVGDGDIVILRQQYTADNGDMVAVWLPETNETTLKHFFRDGVHRVRLQPANPHMEPIFVDASKVEIQGRVLAVMRSL